ncbi:sulfide:quinone oxidoreductase [Ardenticatena maritima]|uniref:Oxidoreductase n=1 Tax=Ardenticatena maritima TaxID=872965 RepID=A0A0M9UCI9_9CHLR|nr:FAD/NAD(P)-binding oxidoreductase [Ardenticatena maritima]KPL89480.1 oxidoreductase [Ardenticatena maritima]GAP62987.1 sulfide:quinone oxidoreductase [Ardenticatena maritima]
MKRIVILGAGTAGTMLANRLARMPEMDDWRITVVDATREHYYQPGFLLLPFGVYGKDDVVRPKRYYLPAGAELIFAEVDRIRPDQKVVELMDGRKVAYDVLVIATGSHIHPEETPGLMEHEWHKTIHTFYDFEGAVALADALRHFKEGRLVLNVAEMPIKCPVAPLEFVFLADWYFTHRGLRDRVEIVYTTPLPGAFTKPKATEMLGTMLEERGIRVVPEFNVMEVDPDARILRSYDEQEVEYDLLVSIPVHMGADAIARSEMGDELNFVPTDRHTLLAKGYDDIFVLGDATDLPASKAGSVAHFEVDVFMENFRRYLDGLELLPLFDGHSNCFIETGYGKGVLIDFNYDVEPLPGMFPLPGVGPMPLLKESRVNHWGKLMFHWMYWNILLKGRELPIPARMSMAGKRL